MIRRGSFNADLPEGFRQRVSSNKRHRGLRQGRTFLAGRAPRGRLHDVDVATTPRRTFANRLPFRPLRQAACGRHATSAALRECWRVEGRVPTTDRASDSFGEFVAAALPGLPPVGAAGFTTKIYPAAVRSRVMTSWLRLCPPSAGLQARGRNVAFAASIILRAMARRGGPQRGREGKPGGLAGGVARPRPAGGLLQRPHPCA